MLSDSRPGGSCFFGTSSQAGTRQLLQRGLKPALLPSPIHQHCFHPSTINNKAIISIIFIAMFTRSTIAPSRVCLRQASAPIEQSSFHHDTPVCTTREVQMMFVCAVTRSVGAIVMMNKEQVQVFDTLTSSRGRWYAR